jgi:hypothetical protein
MKFKYITFGDEPPKSVNFMGMVEFELDGEPVEVTDKTIINKLKGNMCFEEVKDVKPTVVTPPAKEKAATTKPAQKKSTTKPA